MRFFSNSAINRIYVHSALQGFAENGAGIFVSVYLVKLGFAPEQAILVMAGFVLLRLLFRQAVVPLALRIGMRGTLVVACLLTALAYMPLAFVHRLDWVMLLWMVMSSMGESWYWSTYHANSALIGDAEVRGTQVSLVQVIAALNSIVAPLVGGFALALAGPFVAFPIAFVAQALAALPLLGIANNKPPGSLRVGRSKRSFAAAAYGLDGFQSATFGLVWNLWLFKLLGESFQNFGLVMAASGVAGALMSLGLGRLIDLGHPKASTSIAFSGQALASALRIAALNLPFAAVAAHSVWAIFAPLYGAAFNSRLYNLAKVSGDPLRYHVVGEGGWDIGHALGALVAAVLIWAGWSWRWPLTISLVATAGDWILLYRSYSKDDPSLRL